MSMLSVILLSMAHLNLYQPSYSSYFEKLNAPLSITESAYGQGVSTEIPFFKQHPDYAKELVARSFLKYAIYFAEGVYPNSRGLDPYKIIVGYSTLDDYGKDFSDHPRVDIWLESIGDSSDAAGVCQFLSTTWDGLHREYPDVWYEGPAFSPKNQDLACLINFHRTGGYQILMGGVSVSDTGRITVDVEAFTDAVAAACGQWASFPDRSGRACIGEGKQYAKPIEEIWQNFNQGLDEMQAAFLPGADFASNIAPQDPNPPASTPEELFPERLRVPLKDKEIVEGCFYEENGAKHECFVTDTIRIREKHPVTGDTRWHKGFDIGMTVGTNLYAPMNGSVTCEKDVDPWGIYGVFESDEIKGQYFLLHHLTACAAKNGEKVFVTKGQVIGKSGDAGTGPHLHIEGHRLVNGTWEFYEFAKGWATAFCIGDLPRT